MASLPTPLSIPQLQQTFIASYAAAVDPSLGVTPANIPRGDPITALGFATSGVAVYLQSQINSLIAFSRASTSTGSALDSWLADFGPQAARPPGGKASGTVSIPTSTGAEATAAIPIPAGTVFQTVPIVISPSTVPTVYYFATTSAATIAIGATNVLIPYQATLAGSIVNGVPATTPLQLSRGISGTGAPVFAYPAGQSSGPLNPAGGTDAASDPAARQDFVVFIDSLASANYGAIQAAVDEISSYLQLGKTYNIWDYANQPTFAQPGQAVVVYVSPNPALTGQYTSGPGLSGDDIVVDSIISALQATEAYTISPIVYYANTYLITTLEITIVISQAALGNSGLTLDGLKAALQAEIQEAFGPPGSSGLGITQGLSFSQLSRICLDFSVPQPSGEVVTDIVTDFATPSAVAIVTTPAPTTITYSGNADDGPLPGATKNVPDPSGVLRMNTSVNVTWATSFVP